MYVVYQQVQRKSYLLFYDSNYGYSKLDSILFILLESEVILDVHLHLILHLFLLSLLSSSDEAEDDADVE